MDNTDTHNIIFLDVDGVLNGNSYLTGLCMKFMSAKTYHKIASKFPNFEIYGVHESKVRRLAMIVHETNAKVIMSSSWRDAYWRYVTKGPDYFKYHPNDIERLHKLLTKYGITISGITPHDAKGVRQNEIITWLAHNEEGVRNVCILDDEWSDLMVFYGSNLIITSDARPGKPIAGTRFCREGLRMKHVRKAIKILNTPRRIYHE